MISDCRENPCRSECVFSWSLAHAHLAIFCRHFAAVLQMALNMPLIAMVWRVEASWVTNTSPIAVPVQKRLDALFQLMLVWNNQCYLWLYGLIQLHLLWSPFFTCCSGALIASGISINLHVHIFSLALICLFQTMYSLVFYISTNPYPSLLTCPQTNLTFLLSFWIWVRSEKESVRTSCISWGFSNKTLNPPALWK